LLNDDDDYIYIPNNLVFVSDVINYTKRQVKRTSIEFEIDLKYLTNVEELERNMIETLRPFHMLIKDDSYYLRVTEVKKDLVMMKFQYILKEPNKELERQIRRKTIRRLVDIISDREKVVDNITELPE
jgi:MscS family membrane protein